LASKLIGWNVDIKSEEEKRQELEAQMAALTAPGTPLSELQGMGPKTVEKIEAAGISTIEKLADMTPEQLMEIPGIGEKMVEKIQLAVAAHFQSLESQPAAEIGDVAEGQEIATESVEAAGQEAETAAATEDSGSPLSAESAEPAEAAEASPAIEDPAPQSVETPSAPETEEAKSAGEGDKE
jgi:N utilization substance protein A